MDGSESGFEIEPPKRGRPRRLQTKQMIELDVLRARGLTVPEICARLGISRMTYYRIYYRRRRR